MTAYFPVALAISRSRPLDFNFDLRFLDSLSLPCAIVPRGQAELVPTGEAPAALTFATAAEGIKYCRDNLRSGWSVGDAERSKKQKRLTHPGIDKARLFYQEGEALENLLLSGIPTLDDNLRKVRLDR